MKKKNIIFSIGAAVLLVVLSFSCMVTAGGSDRVPPELKRQVDQFITDHNSELSTLDRYLSGLQADTPAPPEILALVNSLSEEMREIYTPYMEQGQQPWHGITSYWKTSNGVQINPPRTWHYWGHCITLSQSWTWSFLDIILVGVHIASLILLFLISAIPWIGWTLFTIIATYIAAHHAEWVAWAQQIYNTQQYGIGLFAFDPQEVYLWNILKHKLQPNYDWQSQGPGVMLLDENPIYQEYNWYKVLPS
jgi:hypothetical protein